MPTAVAPRIEELARGLGAAVGRLNRLLARETAHTSRTTLSVLGSLRGGPKRITELAAFEHVAQPTMTVLVSRLEQRGWVERRPDPTDGRAVRVALTPAGSAVVDELVAARTAFLSERLRGLSEPERETLAAALPLLEGLVAG